MVVTEDFLCLVINLESLFSLGNLSGVTGFGGNLSKTLKTQSFPEVLKPYQEGPVKDTIKIFKDNL